MPKNEGHLTPNWQGPLTPNTAEEVAERLNRLLTSVRFTIVRVIGLEHCQPDVRPSVRLNPGGITVMHLDGNVSEIRFTAGGSVFSFSSHNEDEDRTSPFVDPLVDPHFSFERGKIIISSRTEVGYIIYWAFVPELDSTE